MCVNILLYRYNLNILEEWVRENGLMEDELMDGSVISMLHPMIQASKLLQMKGPIVEQVDLQQKL